MTDTRKCYSTDDEMFNCDSFGDLVDSIDGPAVGDTYYEADCRSVAVTDFVSRMSVDSILESMDESLYDQIGESFDSECSDVTAEAKAELLSFLSAWAEKHVNVKRYWLIVGKSREKQFTAEDLA